MWTPRDSSAQLRPAKHISTQICHGRVARTQNIGHASCSRINTIHFNWNCCNAHAPPGHHVPVAGRVPVQTIQRRLEESAAAKHAHRGFVLCSVHLPRLSIAVNLEIAPAPSAVKGRRMQESRSDICALIQTSTLSCGVNHSLSYIGASPR